MEHLDWVRLVAWTIFAAMLAVSLVGFVAALERLLLWATDTRPRLTDWRTGAKPGEADQTPMLAKKLREVIERDRSL